MHFRTLTMIMNNRKSQFYIFLKQINKQTTIGEYAD